MIIEYKHQKATVDVNPKEISQEVIEETTQKNIGLIRDLVRQGMQIDNAINQVFGPVINNATKSEKEGLNKVIFQIKNLLAQEKGV